MFTPTKKQGPNLSNPNEGPTAVSPLGLLTHPRWLNEDGSYKTGLDLEVEKLKVEIGDIARRLLRVAHELRAAEENVMVGSDLKHIDRLFSSPRHTANSVPPYGSLGDD